MEAELTHQSVAIIGAGPSGLAACKSSLEVGLLPTVYEKASDLGGLWKGHTGIWKSMRANLSKFTCSFSDFPWDECSGICPTNEELLLYLQRYADHFHLRQYIRFNKEITSVKKENNKWIIGNNEEKTEFDFVIVTTGVFAVPHYPNIKGLENFAKNNRISHSYNYWENDEFAGKKVVVIGGSYSGAEISAEISKVADEVHNVIKYPLWISPRHFPPNNTGTDLVIYTRAWNELKKTKSEGENNRAKNQFLNRFLSKQGVVCPDLYIDPNSEENTFIIISDDYVPSIEKGKVIIHKADILEFDETGMILNEKGEIKHVDCDCAVFCTGFEPKLDFLADEIKSAIGYDPQNLLQPALFHKCTFSTYDNTIAFAGIYRGPYYGIMELQGRWATLVFAGIVPPPSQEDLQKGIDAEIAIRNMNPAPQFPHPDYVSFADSIAKEIGVFPELDKSDTIYRALWEGPLLPAHFRLCGPFNNPEVSRSTIRNALIASGKQDLWIEESIN